MMAICQEYRDMKQLYSVVYGFAVHLGVFTTLLVDALNIAQERTTGDSQRKDNSRSRLNSSEFRQPCQQR
jgi:hypothetical protein